MKTILLTLLLLTTINARGLSKSCSNDTSSVIRNMNKGTVEVKYGNKQTGKYHLVKALKAIEDGKVHCRKNKDIVNKLNSAKSNIILVLGRI